MNSDLRPPSPPQAPPCLACTSPSPLRAGRGEPPSWSSIDHLPTSCTSSCLSWCHPSRFSCSSGLVLGNLKYEPSPWFVCPGARCMILWLASCRQHRPCCRGDAQSAPTRWTSPRLLSRSCPGAPLPGRNHFFQTLLCRPPPRSRTPRTTGCMWLTLIMEGRGQHKMAQTHHSELLE